MHQPTKRLRKGRDPGKVGHSPIKALLLLPMLLLLPIPLTAQPPSSEAVQRLELRPIQQNSRRLSERAQNRSSRLFSPFFSVDPRTGVVSLFALRNTTSSQISLSLLFYLADGQIFESTPTLAPKATLTVNVGDLNLPTDVDLEAVVGMGDFAVVDPVTGVPIPSDALVGDSFQVDPTNNFATGDPLAETRDLCNRINTRFADGGVFDGTTFTIGVPDFQPNQGSGVIATATVYDEAGQNMGTFSVTPGKRVHSVTTADLAVTPNLTLPTFGSIEWTLSNNLQGFITWAMNAGGKFSVGMNGSCLD